MQISNVSGPETSPVLVSRAQEGSRRSPGLQSSGVGAFSFPIRLPLLKSCLASGFFFFRVIFNERIDYTPKAASLAPLMSFAESQGSPSVGSGCRVSPFVTAVAFFFPASCVYFFKDVSPSLAKFGFYSSMDGDLT